MTPPEIYMYMYLKLKEYLPKVMSVCPAIDQFIRIKLMF